MVTDQQAEARRAAKEHFAELAAKRDAFLAATLPLLGDRQYVELRCLRHDQIVVLHRNVDRSDPEHPWRITWFDRFGPTGHMVYPSAEKALQELVYDADTEDISGTIDKLVGTEDWDEGMRRLAEVEEFNKRMRK